MKRGQTSQNGPANSAQRTETRDESSENGDPPKETSEDAKFWKRRRPRDRGGERKETEERQNVKQNAKLPVIRHL